MMTPRSPEGTGGQVLIISAAMRVMLKVPTRLILIVRANPSSVWVPSRPMIFSAGATPAQLTSPLRCPISMAAAAVFAGDVGGNESGIWP